jgi:hypothetical protein
MIARFVDHRLIVKVGEKLDIYWDIFRDFLISGKVAIQETYILRLRPSTTSRLLRYVVAARRDVSVTDAASKLGTSPGVVFSAARELRQLGILTPRSGIVALAEPLKKDSLSEDDLKARVSSALKKYSVHDSIASQLARDPRAASVNAVARRSLRGDLMSLSSI